MSGSFWKRKLVRFGAALAGGGLLATLALSPAYAAAADQTYPLGALFPLSGPNAIYNKVFSRGTDMAVEDVNSSGKIDGKLKVIYVDSQALPQPAVLGMNKLVNVNKVNFVLSAFSGVSKAIAPIGNRAHTIMVNGGGVSPELAIGGYLINDIPLVDDEVKVLWPYVVDQMKLKKIAVVHVNDPFGNVVSDVIHDQCKKLGCEVTTDISISPSATNFQSEVVKVRASGPDAVYLASYGEQQGVLAKQLRDGGVDAQLLSYSGFGVPATVKLSAAQDTIFTSQHMNWDANDMTRQFHSKFEKKYGTSPSYYSANYYNAVLVYADLIHYLQENHQKVTGENLLAALHKIATFEVVGGKITFRENGTVQMPIAINQIKDGKPTVLKVVKP